MSVTNPIEGFLDLLELRETLNTMTNAQKATLNALTSLKKYQAQMDASTIKRLEAQAKKMETAVERAKKALSTSSKKKLPQELKDFFKKEMKVLKKTLPASVFGSPRYSYNGESLGYGYFHIIVPVQDFQDIVFTLEINFIRATEGYRSWNGWVPAKPARVETKTYLQIRGEYGKYDAKEILEFLKNEEYIHYPNIGNIQAIKQAIREKLEQDIARLPRWLDGQIRESKGNLYIEAEGHTSMRWEYDQDTMNWEEWQSQARALVADTVKEVKALLPNYDYESGGMGESGHYSIYLTPKN